MRFGWMTVAVVAGCGGLPDVQTVDALDGDSVVASLDPQDVDETVFADDLPTAVGFDVTFDETMSLPSARDNLWVEDQDGVQLEVDLTARLQTITVVPLDPLAAGENHTLVIRGAIEDNSGNEMLSGYRIAFYTAEEP